MDYVIIGNGAAGVAAAEKLAKLDTEGHIILLTAEWYSVYSKCLLPDLLGGQIGEDRLYIRDADFYRKHNIRIYHHHKVVRVDFDKKCVTTEHTDESGRERTVFHYDRLLIATGSTPTVPKIKGLDTVPYHTLATLDDARRIKNEAKSARKVTIIGAGFVGLEIAFSLYKDGREVTIIEKAPRVLPAQLDDTTARMLKEALEEEGIRVFLAAHVDEIRAGGWSGLLRVLASGKQKHLILSDGRTLKSDMVIVATGSRPNLDFLRHTRLRINRGIPVDSCMRTSIPDVFAAGDVAETVDAVTGHSATSPIWPNAVIQGEVAAYNMAGVPTELTELISMQNASEFREIPMISMGIVDPRGSEYEVLCDYRPSDGVYRKLVLKNDIVVGMIFLGDIRNSGVIGALMKQRTNVGKIKSNMLNPNFGYSEVAALI